MAKKSKGNVLIICSHSDDQILGAGGTMARYADEGYGIYTIILSFGESFKPHIKRELVTKERVKESQRADRIIGGKGVTFIGLRDLHFEEDMQRRGILESLKRKIVDIDPVKIFTHASDDAHPDHRATFRIVLKLYRRLRLSSELYSFEVWHLFNLRKRNKPKLVIDISSTFSKKMEALKAFKSQINLSSIYSYIFLNNFLFFVVTIRNKLNGMKHDSKYAEVFYKIR